MKSSNLKNAIKGDFMSFSNILTILLYIILFLAALLIPIAISFWGVCDNNGIPNRSKKLSLRIVGRILVFIAFIISVKFLPHFNINGFSIMLVNGVKETGATENIFMNITITIWDYFLIIIEKLNSIVFNLLNISYMYSESDFANNWKTYILGVIIVILSYYIIVFITRTGDTISKEDFISHRETDLRNSKKAKNLYLKTNYDVDCSGKVSATTKLVDATNYESYSTVFGTHLFATLLSAIFFPGLTILLFLIMPFYDIPKMLSKRRF